MILREEVCSNRQSTIIWKRGVWPNHHVTFIVATKLILKLFCSIYNICGGRGLVENVIWVGCFAENVRISSYGRRGSKTSQKPSYI